MTDGQNFFDQLVRNKLRTYDSTQKLATGQGLITQLVVFWTIIISKNIIR